ncbi:MAG: lysophospholipase [Alphaproteobacteria bacterium]|nr:MAG: lysophospholipase [Alphaproteobacteria bacterium]
MVRAGVLAVAPSPRLQHRHARHMPVRGLVELRKVADELERRLPDIACPAAVVHGTDDPIAEPESARIIHERIGSAEKSLHMIPSQRHGILHEDIADTMSWSCRSLTDGPHRKFMPLPRCSRAPSLVRRSRLPSPGEWLLGFAVSVPPRRHLRNNLIPGKNHIRKTSTGMPR